MMESDSLAILYFNKSGFMLVLTAAKHKKDKPVEVSLINKGNVDIRKLPFPKDAEIESMHFQYINTATKLSVAETEAFYKEELAKLGWKQVNRLGQGVMTFTQNAIELNIEIQADSNKQTAIKVQTGMR